MTEKGRYNWWPYVGLFAAAVFLRWPTIGHPLLHMDENFYLLVGNRMVQDGVWPYVDIWDRKPVGLFVLYAALSAIKSDSFVPYQVAALFSATLTAWIIVRIASGIVAQTPAFTGGILYLVGLTFFGGYGGQAPVFYNLIVAAAALVLVRTVMGNVETNIRPNRRLFSGGCLCMLLIGIAMQIKYSVVFEGLYFGLILLYAARTAPGSGGGQ